MNCSLQNCCLICRKKRSHKVERDQLRAHRIESIETQTFLLNGAELLSVPSREMPRSLGQGLIDGAIVHPIQAIGQLCNEKKLNQGNKEPREDHEKSDASYDVGEIVGSLLPFAAVACSTRRINNKLFGLELIPSAVRQISEQATNGFVT